MINTYTYLSLLILKWFYAMTKRNNFNDRINGELNNLSYSRLWQIDKDSLSSVAQDQLFIRRLGAALIHVRYI